MAQVLTCEQDTEGVAGSESGRSWGPVKPSILWLFSFFPSLVSSLQTQRRLLGAQCRAGSAGLLALGCTQAWDKISPVYSWL